MDPVQTSGPIEQFMETLDPGAYWSTQDPQKQDIKNAAILIDQMYRLGLPGLLVLLDTTAAKHARIYTAGVELRDRLVPPVLVQALAPGIPGIIICSYRGKGDVHIVNGGGFGRIDATGHDGWLIPASSNYPIIPRLVEPGQLVYMSLDIAGMSLVDLMSYNEPSIYLVAPSENAQLAFKEKQEAGKSKQLPSA